MPGLAKMGHGATRIHLREIHFVGDIKVLFERHFLEKNIPLGNQGPEKPTKERIYAIAKEDFFFNTKCLLNKLYLVRNRGTAETGSK